MATKKTVKKKSTKTTPKKETKMGRPKLIIDSKQFEAMCGIQCTKEEICNVLNVSDSTLSRWCKSEYDLTFEEIYKKKSDVGKMSLRRLQFKIAQKNASMAIFLGKQYLGQRDVVVNEDKNLPKVEELLSKIQNEAKIINSVGETNGIK